MKLVDILARKLKVWPEGVECLSQMKGTGYIINGKGFDGRAFDSLQIADETLVAGAIVTRAEWQAEVDALNAPKVVEWDGSGLPPVGIDCEMKKEKSWVLVKILAHVVDDPRFNPIAIYMEANDPSAFVGQAVASRFRSVRTDEQVAAEERKSEILEMIDTFGTDTAIWGRDAVMEICGHLWESGYRKQVAK